MGLKLLFLLFSFPALASYRVYQLKVFHYDQAGVLKSEETLLSNLDPLQYEHYNNGFRWDRVVLVDSWYCPGDTSGKKFCSKPKWTEPFVKDPRDKRNYLPYNWQPVIP